MTNSDTGSLADRIAQIRALVSGVRKQAAEAAVPEVARSYEELAESWERLLQELERQLADRE